MVESDYNSGHGSDTLPAETGQDIAVPPDFANHVEEVKKHPSISRLIPTSVRNIDADAVWKRLSRTQQVEYVTVETQRFQIALGVFVALVQSR